ncbi:MAG TPA: Mur ligase family protein [Candidatus Saccharibacteria bacterium]|nr:Mur ligase family protein [Candidatus Saccharibacteria bacterium]
MEITGFAQAEQVLAGFVPPARKFREAYTLDNMQKLMAELGNPQDSYRVIHVAGTSGKTSTAYYVAALLKHTGKKVGLSVSPHIDQLNERLQINLEPLSESTYCQELTEFLEMLNKLNIKPTYFELLVAFAYWQFAKQKVDYAVIEVGLGGLLDGTNVVTRPDKVCVITDIGLDHTHVLGTTLPEIAFQKAGIIHPGNNVFCYKQSAEVSEVITKVCTEKGATLHQVTNKETTPGLASLPLFQQRNWGLAKVVADFVIDRDGLQTLSKDQVANTLATYVPGRIEAIAIRNKTIVMDGAHNAQKMRALRESLGEKYPKQKFAVVLGIGMTNDEKTGNVLDELLPIASRVIVTPFYAQQDFRKHATSRKKIVDQCLERGFTNVYEAKDVKDAYGQLVKSDEPHVLICGSFYLLNKIRPILFNDTRGRV